MMPSWPARRRTANTRDLRQFFLVAAGLVVLMAGAAVLAIQSHAQSQTRYQDALAARADAARVQEAALVLWQEREAINEYLYNPKASLVAEVAARKHTFDAILEGADPNPLPHEGTLISAARAANATLLEYFRVDRATPGETPAQISQVDVLGDRVIDRVDTVVRLNLTSVRARQADATSAASNALEAAIAAGVLMFLLLGVFSAYVVKLVRDLRRHALRSEHTALHDPLTDLPNRTLFRDRVEHEILRGSRDPGATFSLLMFDLDRFKEINDTLGHSSGDLVLKAVGPRVMASLRSGDTLSRLSGDEFAVLLPGATGETATDIAERILATLRRPFEIPVMSPRLSASIGIVTYPTHGDTSEKLIQRADVALYIAKEHRNSFATYDFTSDPYNPARLELASDLDRAVANDEFELHYQPILDTRTMELVSVEALIRWHHPERGLLYPGEFIALAEHTGLIKQMTLLVLKKAIHQVREWRDEGHMRAVSVNLSASSLLDDELVGDVTRILASEEIDASQLALEITETMIMADPQKAQATLLELNALGIRLSIDDFGTGHSSLAYLRHLPVHEIKIDKSFVQQIERNDDDAKIVQSTIELAHSLGFSVVAEGVEDQEALELLSANDCDQVQGFHLCRPQPAAELSKALRRLAASQQSDDRRGRVEPALA
jgi:diguanylate cyclase (GGDEF)-like protein